ncbi:hypothetical protein L210DRAFT_3660690 [Boletus edulis BED1]|uniref:Uncharacterized protein n=1 Tax=Boletus edulis BED1 TaxID=1328754 RepID=A0AAD4C963_BOLED|nr:hypothetical protein L210DRAFT_3660690 [Boletus edulis BED1]
MYHPVLKIKIPTARRKYSPVTSMRRVGPDEGCPIRNKLYAKSDTRLDLLRWGMVYSTRNCKASKDTDSAHQRLGSTKYLRDMIIGLTGLDELKILPGHPWPDSDLPREKQVCSSQTSFNPLGMFEYNDQYAHDQQIHHRWVAEQQGTLVAVLPVHTREERDLFRLLVHSSPLSSDAATRHPNWTSLAAVWATHANRKTIFYNMRDLTTQTAAITSQADLVITLQLPEQSHPCTSLLTTVGLESHCPDGASDDPARHTRSVTRSAQSQHDTRNLQSAMYSTITRFNSHSPRRHYPSSHDAVKRCHNDRIACPVVTRIETKASCQ